VDDAPANNLAFRQVLRGLGAGVEPARDTLECLALAATSHFDLIVSDIDRGNENGIDGLRRLREAGVKAPATFYVRQVDRSRPVPETALGITHLPDELLHLVIDGLERARWTQLETAEQSGAANGSQPDHIDSNRTSSPAGSRR
jgi:DNA-binding NtrC family response regulator